MDPLSQIPSKKSMHNSENRERRTRSVDQTVKFARRTSSGRYTDLPMEDLDMPDETPRDPMDYTVHIPLTPDSQPMPTSAAPSSFVFTGGLDDSKMMSQGSCSMQGCDGESMRDERGNSVYPCPCRFEICVDCLCEAEKNSGSCPGCKQAYSSNKSFTIRSQSGELENKGGVFETQGAYNDYCSKDGFYGHDTDGIKAKTMDKPWIPLSRKLPIRASVISPYRLLIFTRAVALGFFLAWRIQHPNDEAVWLWIMSVICEIWFAFAWILDQVPKISPINRSTDLIALQDRFDMPSPSNPTGRSDLPGVDIFVSTTDPVKESPLVTANTILSILAVDYPVDKLACYVSDDGASLLTFEAMAEAAGFADTWVPFCRKHSIESRNPESYFNMKGDPTKNKSRSDFVKDRRKVKREYDEFKVSINGLQESIRRRSDAYNAREEVKMVKQRRETGADQIEPIKVHKATWMADGTHWAGTWTVPSADHSKEDHAGILQMMMKAPSCDPVMGCAEETLIDFTDVDIRLPMFVYVSREKRLGYDHNKKAGAMNALARASAILSNGPFILNLDCDRYIYNCKAVSEGMCFMLDRGGENICYVQFPQRFDGVDPSDRYANNNNVFFDGYMRALDGLQGPVYVGTGCLFRRYALYGFDPPEPNKLNRNPNDPDMHAVRTSEFESDIDVNLLPKRFGNSSFLTDSIVIAEYQGRPLADHPMVKYGRHPGVLTTPREPLDAAAVADAVSVISIWYEDKTAWGENVGWIYGSVREELVTGYRMHNRGWRSVYCITKRDAFRGSASINLTDRLHQVLQRATSCVELFFSRNSALIASKRLKLLQRIAYLNIGIYPFTSLFLVVYCFLPSLCLFSGHFIIQSVNITLLVYLLLITFCLIGLAVLEMKWSGIGLEEWWRNEQFWVISGTSAHLAAVIQGLLKTIAGVDVSFSLTSKTVPADDDDKFADLYTVKWSSLMVLPIAIGLVNIIALVVGFSRTIYSKTPEWSEFIIRAAFSSWVLVHLYPFAKGLMGRRGKTPTIVFVWSGLVAIILSLLWISVNPQIGPAATGAGDASARGALQIP